MRDKFIEVLNTYSKADMGEWLTVNEIDFALYKEFEVQILSVYLECFIKHKVFNNFISRFSQELTDNLFNSIFSIESKKYVYLKLLHLSGLDFSSVRCSQIGLNFVFQCALGNLDFVQNFNNWTELLPAHVECGFTAACMNGHFSILQNLKDNHRILDFTFGDTISLDLAVYNGHLSVVRYLLNECGLVAHIKYKHFSSCSSNGHVQLLEYLQSIKADTNFELSIFRLASQHNQIDIIKYLFRKTKGEFHLEILKLVSTIAASNGFLDQIEYYFSLPFVELKNIEWLDKLYVHAACGDQDSIMCYFENNYPGHNFQNLLNLEFANLVQSQCYSAIKRIQNLGLVSEEDRDFAFKLAMSRANVELINLYSADKSFNKILENINIYFAEACSSNNPNFINFLLIKEELNIDYSYDDNKALRTACEFGSERVVALLLNLPNINPSIHDFAPLKIAIRYSHVPIIQMLCNWGRLNGHALRISQILRDNNYNINFAQSIHVKSVHTSVAESALRLNQHYGHHVSSQEDLVCVLSDIRDRISGLTSLPSESLFDAALVLRSAKRFVQNADNPDVYSKLRYKEPSSKLTTQKLLALTYLAVLDFNSFCTNIRLNDILVRWLEGLYQAQRGYNIDEEGIDDALDDKPICASGAFNQIIYSLSGFHIDVNVIFITLTQATLKLPYNCMNVAFKHIKSLRTTLSDSDYESFLNQFKDNGIDYIWSDIKNDLTSLVLNEFGSLFDGGVDSSIFEDFLSAGKCMSIEPVLMRLKIDTIVNEISTGYILNHPVKSTLLEQLNSVASKLNILWPHIKESVENEFIKNYPQMNEIDKKTILSFAQNVDITMSLQKLCFNSDLNELTEQKDSRKFKPSI